jgi:predicted membrane channel-forming protein YqfA (hemolysin III family)
MMGILAGVVGAPILMGIAAAIVDLPAFSATLLYSVCLLTMLGCSAAYNLASNARLLSSLQPRLQRIPTGVSAPA